MAKPVTKAKLDAIGKQLSKLCPQFDWVAMSAKEIQVLGDYDPPCAVLRGEWGPFRIDLDQDGYLYMGDHQASVDLSQKPADIAAAVIAAVDLCGPYAA